MADVFERIEAGSGKIFQQHMRDMKYKYEMGVNKYLLKDYHSIFDLFDIEALRNPFILEFWESYHHSIAKKFKNPRI